MLRLSLLGLLWAGGALAQGNHAINGFNYRGCVQISRPPAYEVALGVGNCTPEACQEACMGCRYAAVYPTVCKCANEIGAPTYHAEDQCENWCDGYASLGKCGSCEREGYSNLYECEIHAWEQAPPPYSAPIPPVPVPVPHTSTSCMTIVSVHTSWQTPYVDKTTWTAEAYPPTTRYTSWTTPVLSEFPPPLPPGYGEGQPTVVGGTIIRSGTTTVVIGQTPVGYGGSSSWYTPASGGTYSTHPHTGSTSYVGGLETDAAEAGANSVGASLLGAMLAVGVAVL